MQETKCQLQECQQEPERFWEGWKASEAKSRWVFFFLPLLPKLLHRIIADLVISRLAHSWVIVDQEMSLFSDTAPILSIVNLHSPMPDADALWQANSPSDWLMAFESVHGSNYSNPSSLRQLFTRFVAGEIEEPGMVIPPLHLRLLLHPLQTQVCQLRQFLTCLPDGGSHAKASRTVSKAATKARLEEISMLLQQWYSISKQSASNRQETCWTTCANLIMYHLISLNAITSFKDIEQFARREVVVGPFRHAAWLQSRCIDQAEETSFHCGQVLRLIRSMPEQVRPSWWAGAIYRVALTYWANSMANVGSRFPTSGHSVEADRPIAIDALTPEDPAITRYLKYQEGQPVLSKPDGSFISTDVPNNILKYCIDLLEEDSSMRLTDGIKRKLRIFLAGWKES